MNFKMVKFHFESVLKYHKNKGFEGPGTTGSWKFLSNISAVTVLDSQVPQFSILLCTYYITEILFTGITAKNAKLQNEEQLSYCSKQKGNCCSLKFFVTMKIIRMCVSQKSECM